jgi:uncharacterized radical SAM superfamily protein
MNQLSPETVWQVNQKELSTILEKNLSYSRPKKIRFYAPSFMYYNVSHYHSSIEEFPAISVTAGSCSLKCKHCGGIVLETMYPAMSPKKLFELCLKLKGKGAKGCLISGGCLPNGSVPIERFLPEIERVKRELGLTVFVHTGIIDARTAKELKDATVDAALIDIIGSDETINEIYKLKLNVSDYDNSLKALKQSGIAFVPHVIVGLHYGKLKGEFDALRMIEKYGPSAIVVIGFMPIRGTEMEGVKPPEPFAIAKVITVARLMFPEIRLVLGCMRPKGRHRTETDRWAVKAGVDGIAFPAEEAIRLAEIRGLSVSFSSFCCSQIYDDFKS